MRLPAFPQEMMLIGIDVGGTKTAIGGVAAADGEVLDKRVVATPALASTGRSFVEHLCVMAGAIKDEAAALGWQCGGIGVSLCELVDLAGNPASGFRVEWRYAHARELFSTIAPCVIEADVRAAARAEAWRGRGRDFRCFAYVNLGTGVSSCFVIDGVPYPGARGAALVLGTGPALNVDPAGQTSSYVPEEVAGGAGIVARYNAAGHNVESALDVLARAEAGDTAATEIAALGGKVAGAGIGFLVNVIDPEAVIVGGGLATHDGIYWHSAVTQARATIWNKAARDLPILQAGLGADSALIGAALSALPAEDSSQRKHRAG
ncbi:MAG: ROK family protein [Rhodospirillaceae bacterium]|nr:ROK family protein [Rhodospirillaceae bacterium]